MGDTAITVRNQRSREQSEVLRWYSLAALTTGVKAEFIITRHCHIKDVIVDSGTAGSGGTSDIIDVHKNGTTIYTTQGNRPTLLTTNTGMWAEAAEPEVTALVPGDILLVEVDQIAATGSAKVNVAIILSNF